jgi:hypothetical protein
VLKLEYQKELVPQPAFYVKSNSKQSSSCFVSPNHFIPLAVMPILDKTFPEAVLAGLTAAIIFLMP